MATGTIIAPADDVVIAEGTDGVWHWKKWKSGRAECEGKTSHTLTLDQQWASVIYYNDGGAIQADLPSGLFASVEGCQYGVSGASASGADCWPCVATAAALSTSKTCGIYLLRINAAGTARTFYVTWRVFGRWRT